jgi:phosphate transport system protein
MALMNERVIPVARISFEKEMEKLQNQLMDLGVLVENAVLNSVEILKVQDVEAAQRLVAADAEINRMRYTIESETLILIARQQPMAGDLRTLAAVLEIATELERIADYAKGIAKITIKLGIDPLMKPLIDIPRMAVLSADMLHRALLCFTDRDANMARAIASEDQVLDDLYDQVYRELITYVMADPRNIDGANHLMWVAHNLERTADRSVNICERVIFMTTGEMIELDDGDLMTPGESEA